MTASPSPLSFANFADRLNMASGQNVSRETLDKLQAYGELLVKWQKAVNLVSNSTLKDLWRRHFLDSAQLLSLIGTPLPSIADIGTGAGFPGMVLAILTNTPVHLIDSDHKKTTFLREVARVTDTPVHVHANRIEDVDIQVGLVVSRALAPLETLLRWQQHLGASTGLYLKGEKASAEIETAKQIYSFNCDISPSQSDPSGHILKISL